jgi:hypothetical protein
MKQYVHSLICPFCIAEALEEGVGDDLVCFQTFFEETAEEGKPKVRSTCAAAAVHEDGKGADCGRRHLQAGIFSAHAVEESDGKSGAASAVVVGRSTGECSKEVVEGALGDRGGLAQQFVEQVVCILLAKRSGADTARGRCKGSVG